MINIFESGLTKMPMQRLIVIVVVIINARREDMG